MAGAMAAIYRCSRVVYVGNIPFHASQEELHDACELIGLVISLRLAADAATSKRKGYAFVEYRDDETARNAYRNLHGHFIRGHQLRVGVADRQLCIGGRRRTDHGPVGIEDTVHAASLVFGAPVEHVMRHRATLSRQQLREMVAELEKHVVAKELLKEQVSWLATSREQAQHLLDMDLAAVAEDARKKRQKRSHRRRRRGHRQRC